ncbi:MAG: leucyl aminopeptidase, partial [Chromatiales bacterium]
MDYVIKKADAAALRTACLVFPIFSTNRLPTALKQIDDSSDGFIKNILKKGDLKNGESCQTLLIYDVPNVTSERLLIVNCGDEKKFDENVFAGIAATAISRLHTSHSTDASVVLPEFSNAHQAYTMVRAFVESAEKSIYEFNQCKSEPHVNKRPLKKITLLVADAKHKASVSKAASHASAIAHGQSLAKDLANLPGNICTPTYLAEQAQQIKRGVRKLKVDILEEKDMQQLGMGALLSVSRGSRQPAKLIVMDYKGASAKQKPIALVGKGLTFDAGGISIKPAANMDEMKYDMCGGATVLGVIQACAELELPINVVGIVPSSENLPDGDANKPGDIVTSMSGQTIEILNTDAEGRLILCDALTYVGKFEPSSVIDIA